MKTTTTILTCLISLHSIAQITFQKTYGGIDYDYGASIIQTSDNGYAILGNTSSFGLSSEDIYLIKLDSIGSIDWSKTYGGNGDEEGISIQQTTDGGYIIAGVTERTSFNQDVFIIRTNSTGDTLWSNTIGGTTSDDEWAYSVIETSTGDFVACGYTYSYGAGGSDVYLVKLSSSGYLLWAKTYGDVEYERGWQVIETLDGGYIITGQTEDPSNYKDDVYLIKTDVNGTLLWNKTFGTYAEDDRGYAVKQAQDKGFIIVGETNSYSTSSDVFVVKIDSLGNLEWSKAYGGTSSDYAESVDLNGSNGFIVGGSTYSFGGDDAFLFNLDASGNIIWSYTYGIPGAAYARSVTQTSDGGYAFSGELSDEVYVVKTDLTGNSGCNQNIISPSTGTIASVEGNSGIEGSGGVQYNTTTIIGNPATIETPICINTGINESQLDYSLTIFPNPFSVSTTLAFENTTGEAFSIEVLDFTGKLVRSITNITDNKVILNKEGLSSGIYLVQLHKESGLVYSEKVLVE